MYSRNCTITGITYCRSRYVTINAEVKSPTPIANKIRRNNKSGTNSRFGPGGIRYQIINPTISGSATAKSMRVDNTVDKGKINRGKYTFETSWEFPTIQALAFVKVLLNA